MANRWYLNSEEEKITMSHVYEKKLQERDWVSHKPWKIGDI